MTTVERYNRSRSKAKRIVEEIKNANLEISEAAYVHSDGEWTRGKDGCQPSYTQAVSAHDFVTLTVDDIIETVCHHLDMYDY
jgi:hypothetical protein